VTDDIDDENRSTNHPDMGADEFTPPAHNLAMNNFYSNFNSPCNIASSIPLYAKIINYGTSTETSIPISYIVNDGQIHTETYTGQLLSLDTLVYTFSSQISLLPTGHQKLKVFTGLSGDSYRNNDTLLSEFDSYISISNFPFYDDLESDTNKYFHLAYHSESSCKLDTNAGYNSKTAIVMEGGSSRDWNYTGNNINQNILLNSQHHAYVRTCDINLTNISHFAMSFDLNIQSSSTYTNWFYVTVNDTTIIKNTTGDSIWNSTNGNYLSLNFDLCCFCVIANLL
jgi:hypothetical protein